MPRQTLRLATGLLLATASALPVSALAQTAPATPVPDEPAAPVLDEIVVTATKAGDTRLQDTALAITAFDENYIDKAVISDLRDLALVTPGLQISENTGRAQIYIRGIGSNTTFTGGDASSTVHVDGVYIGRPLGVFNNFLDVERIEVLRGPQGTLYGRNSVGGTINIISRRPSLSGFHAKGQVTLGNYDLRRFEGYASAGLVEDRLGVSLALQSSNRDGYRENVLPGGVDLDSEDSIAVRGQLMARLSDDADLIVRAEHYESDAPLYGFQTFITRPVGPAVTSASIFGDFGKTAINYPQFAEFEVDGVNAELTWRLSDTWTLRSLTAYRGHRLVSGLDNDATELTLIDSSGREKQDQTSQEFNLIGNFGRSSLVLGAYYMNEKIDGRGSRGFNNYTVGVRRILETVVDDTALAVFGEGRWEFLPGVTGVVGGRYTEETKDFTNFDRIVSIATGATTLVRNMAPQRGKYSKFTSKLGLEYRPNDDVLLYATYSEGFKSGGFNQTGLTPGGFAPENLKAYEAGAKTELVDRRLRLNASVFTYDYQDMQVQAFTTLGIVDITNAASARINGVEVEIAAKPLANLELSATAAYLDATYKSYVAPLAGGVLANVAGNRLNASPEWAYSLHAEYTHPVAIGDLFLRGEYNWQSEVFYTADNNAFDRQKAYGLINAAVGLRTKTWDLELWGRNLADEQYVTATASFAPSGRTARAGPPLTFGIRATMRID